MRLNVLALEALIGEKLQRCESTARTQGRVFLLHPRRTCRRALATRTCRLTALHTGQGEALLLHVRPVV
jgi:hypothetical protein